MIKNLPILALLFLAVSCPALKPDTFNKKLALGYAAVTTARDTARILLESGKIGAEEAQQVQNQADNARMGLDIAHSLYVTDPKVADAKLSITLAELNALNNYLQAKQTK